MYRIQFNAVSRTQQGKQREPSVKTLRSPFSVDFWRHCVLSGGTYASTPEQRNENIFFNKFLRVGIEPTTSCVHIYAMMSLRHCHWPQLYRFSNKTIFNSYYLVRLGYYRLQTFFSTLCM